MQKIGKITQLTETPWLGALLANESLRGAVGPQGERGPMGLAGKNGSDGKDGVDGRDGLPGVDGKDGRDGVDGKDGKDGKRGLKGQRGLRGLQGKRGQDGKAGKDGKDGVKGEKGEKGDPPKHEIDLDKGRIRFERADGTWGGWVEIKQIIKYEGGGGGASVHDVDLLYKRLTGIVGDFDGIDYIDFDTAATPTHQEGRLHWNGEDGTLEVGMPGGTVAQQLGQEIFVPRRVKNTTASTMSNGSLVYISGGTGTNAIVSLAKADDLSTSSTTIAMLTEDVAAGGFGWATSFGLVREVNTSAYSAGDQLFLSASSAGGFTDTMPTHPNTVVRIGKVFRSHATEGIVLIDIEPPITAKCVAGEGGVVWDDIQVGISNIRVPTAKAPTERLYNAGIGGGVTFPFLGFAVNDYLYFDVQTPHAMLLNSILDQHLHFTTPTDGTGSRFQFQLDVIACPIDGTWSVPTGSPFTAERTMSTDDSASQRYFEIATVPASNTTVSTLYKCKLTRIAATADEYAGEVYVSFLDGHYQKDSLGSRNETSKG